MKAYLLKTIHTEVLIHCYQFGKVFLHIHENEKRFVRWPITATAKTKRNTVNKEILINKKSFVHI